MSYYSSIASYHGPSKHNLYMQLSSMVTIECMMEFLDLALKAELIESVHY